MRKLVRWKHCNNLSRNHYFVVGLLFGLILTLFIPEDAWNIGSDDCPEPTEYPQSVNDDFEPRINLINKPMSAKKMVKNIVRPRYYSSELGIREKLFVGVMTSQTNINTLATAFNKTTAHLVNKIKYFINADNVKTNFKLKNIVGFTDIRENLRPFHVLKYIADNYLNDYDYFLLVTDESYIDARRLVDVLYHQSISFDIYMGQRIESGAENSELSADERNFCDLNAGIILSSSVIRKMRANLDWCVRNAVTNLHSLNIGRCVKYSSKLNECQQSFQGINFTNFNLNTFKIYRDLSILKHNEQFNEAIFLHPLTTEDDFYILHIYFSKRHLDVLKSDHINLENESKHISNGTISNDILEIRWPLGVPQSAGPETRHDIIPWTLLNRTHEFMPNHELNTKPLSRIDFEDLQKVLNRTLIYALRQHSDLRFIDIHSTYKRFDPVRGIDYQLHLNFWDTKNNFRILKSYHAVKPLAQIEFIPSPYVTESTRIAMLLPTFEHQVDLSIDFLKRYEQTCMKNHDNTFLMLVFLYRINTPSKGPDDIFNPLKRLALELSENYKTDGSRVAWVSIRLPEIFSQTPIESDIMLSSMYAQNEILSLIVTDIALRKIGLDSLIMICSVSMTFKADFLNRVRMNTVQGFQIFSPIGFMMYPCNFLNLCKDCETCDVSQSAGYFDRNNSDVMAFYSRDYVEARKLLEKLVPIIHTDNDIEHILNRSDRAINNIIDMFIRSKLPIHILRAIEPNLRFGNAIRNYIATTKPNIIPLCPLWYTANSNKCIHIASRKNIGDALLKYENRNQNKIFSQIV